MKQFTDQYEVLTNYKGYDVTFYALIDENGKVTESWQIFDHETADEIRDDHWFTSFQEVIYWIDRPEIWLREYR